MGTGRSSISEAGSYEEIGEFWDTHDADEFWDQTEPADLEFEPKSEKSLSGFVQGQGRRPRSSSPKGDPSG